MATYKVVSCSQRPAYYGRVISALILIGALCVDVSIQSSFGKVKNSKWSIVDDDGFNNPSHPAYVGKAVDEFAKFAVKQQWKKWEF